MAYAPVEFGLRVWLAARFPGVRVVTELPAGLMSGPDRQACIHVLRFGGGDEEFPAFDNANIDIDTYATNRQVARELADAVRLAMRTALEGEYIGTAFVLRVRTMNAPIWTSWDNTDPAARRFSAAYTMRVHHQL